MVGKSVKMTMGFTRKKKEKKKKKQQLKANSCFMFFLKLNEFLYLAMEPLARCFYGSKII
jgi:hypothetical protein